MSFNPDEGIYPETVGPFEQFEKPALGTVPFLDDDGEPLATVGYDGLAWLKQPDGVVVDLTVSVDDAGVADITWPSDGLDQFGTYEMTVWIGNNGNRRFASKRYIFYVYQALKDTAPSGL